uniref:Protein kinase domain-containing protein n=1 Tax=Attheya septentrionalis TaxID=420275 RepID=A0A7S2XKY8_9STRA|mmetsp:Transcript_17638/g.31853  ORF Transcript_17638/g.31853 Transcript_17638/m.31853 type:complete len:496 (+) Transcript_17638:117-1604(+)
MNIRKRGGLSQEPLPLTTDSSTQEGPRNQQQARSSRRKRFTFANFLLCFLVAGLFVVGIVTSFHSNAETFMLQGPSDMIQPNNIRTAPMRSTNAKQILMIHPLQLQYDVLLNTVHEIQNGPTIIDDQEPEPPMESSWDLPYDDSSDDSSDDDKCHFVNENHNRSFPTCSRVHETNTQDMEFINCGGSRCAFKVKDDGSSQASFVFKIQKYRKDMEERRFEKARVDGLVMERATASPFIATVYGNCGVSQILEHSNGGNLHDLIKIARLGKKDRMKPLDKLKILIHIASAVTDIHDDPVSIVHGDLCCHQFLFIDGIYKLNDFHMSQFKRQTTQNQTCDARTSFNSGMRIVHAPEEITYLPANLEKADIYMMGQVMFYVFAKKWIYEGISGERGLKMLADGKLTSFPSGLDMGVRANAVMKDAILSCWKYDPADRPTARSIRDFLLKELSAMEGRTITPGDESLRITIPPLPNDHRYTDSDMETAREKPLRMKFNQ